MRRTQSPKPKRSQRRSPRTARQVEHASTRRKSALEVIIPTLGRVDSQITLAQLPKRWQKRTTLVVQEHEYATMRAKYGATCSVWKLPAGTKGIAWTRYHIAHAWKGKRIFMIDDDMKFVKIHAEGKKLVGKPATDSDFDHAFAEAERFMNAGFVHGGFGIHITPPVAAPYNYNARVAGNMFFSEHFPVHKINFGQNYSMVPEDFLVTLQLLTMGKQNVCFNHFRISPVNATGAAGGCATYRTLEKHNAGQQKLADLFPEFVTVTKKIQKSGPWKGLEKKALAVKWKKAYESSQR